MTTEGGNDMNVAAKSEPPTTAWELFLSALEHHAANGNVEAEYVLDLTKRMESRPKPPPA